MVGNLLNFIYVLISLTNKVFYYQIRKNWDKSRKIYENSIVYIYIYIFFLNLIDFHNYIYNH